MYLNSKNSEGSIFSRRRSDKEPEKWDNAHLMLKKLRTYGMCLKDQGLSISAVLTVPCQD